MAEKLVSLFAFCEKNGGIPAKMRLAMKTGITQGSAATTPDTPDVVAKVAAAIQEITGKAPAA